MPAARIARQPCLSSPRSLIERLFSLPSPRTYLYRIWHDCTRRFQYGLWRHRLVAERDGGDRGTDEP